MDEFGQATGDAYSEHMHRMFTPKCEEAVPAIALRYDFTDLEAFRRRIPEEVTNAFRVNLK